MLRVLIGVGDQKPTPIPKVHDEQYNMDVYPALAFEPKLDIMVPVHAHIELTKDCIESIYQFTGTPFHLLVMDDAPVDDFGLTEIYIKELQKRKKNLTYCKSLIPFRTGNTFFNAALKYSRTPYYATIMNSMTVEPNWEVVALQLMEQNKDLGTVGFKCLFGSRSPKMGLIESAGIEFVGHIPTDMGRDQPGYRCSENRLVEAVQWAFALHRKAALVGNLDETLFNGHVGWDDIDNCLVVKSKGWKILYCGQGVGLHQPRATRGSNTLDAFLRNQENSHTVFKRWGLWNKYLEANKMDVAQLLRGETKDVLGMAVTRLQVLQSLIQEEQARVGKLVNKAMEELKVDPGQYVLEIEPNKNLWQLKPNVQATQAPAQEVTPASDTETEPINEPTVAA